ncbi:MAG TPA: hypothetical protein VFG07_03695 [Thermoplasmata archaeon]|nr:hypothetical protein [Thermoplasmata archaeon]
MVFSVGALLLAGVGYFGSRPTTTAPAPVAVGGPVAITIEIRSSQGIDEVVSPSIHVRAHTLVVFTVENYDPQVVGAPTAAAGVHGTFVGPVSIQTSGMGHPVAFQGLAPALVSHTFSADAGAYQFNVPLPAASPSGAPSSVSFAIFFNDTASFAWFCAAYCNDGGLGDSMDMGGPVVVSPA